MTTPKIVDHKGKSQLLSQISIDIVLTTKGEIYSWGRNDKVVGEERTKWLVKCLFSK